MGGRVPNPDMPTFLWAHAIVKSLESGSGRDLHFIAKKYVF